MLTNDAEKFTSEMHDPCTRQPLPARENNTETPLRGTGVEPAKYPSKVKSGNAFTTLECQRGVNYAYLFVRMLGPFYSSEVLSPFLVEQASSLLNKSHPCRASFILVDQASFLQTKFSETWWTSLDLRSVRGPHKGWALPFGLVDMGLLGSPNLISYFILFIN